VHVHLDGVAVDAGTVAVEFGSIWARVKVRSGWRRNSSSSQRSRSRKGSRRPRHNTVPGRVHTQRAMHQGLAGAPPGPGRGA
jgi:hypothetical protein